MERVSFTLNAGVVCFSLILIKSIGIYSCVAHRLSPLCSSAWCVRTGRQLCISDFRCQGDLFPSPLHEVTIPNQGPLVFLKSYFQHTIQKHSWSLLQWLTVLYDTAAKIAMESSSALKKIPFGEVSWIRLLYFLLPILFELWACLTSQYMPWKNKLHLQW